MASTSSDLVGLKKAALQEDDSAGKTPLPDGSSTPQVTPVVLLSRWSFVVTVGSSVAVLLAAMIVFVNGVVIDTGVLDQLGSSTNVDAKLETYQVINGYVTAAVGMIMESFFEVFLVVTATFLANVRWYPGDQPLVSSNRLKVLCLWAFSPFIMYLINVAVSAAFVSHKATGVVRVFLNEDLVLTKTMSVLTINSSVAANLTSVGNNVSVLDTILRSAVRQEVTPFKMLTDSPCVLKTNRNDKFQVNLPSVKEVRSTAVVFGFPTREWNVDALPFGLLPAHYVEFQTADMNSTDTNPSEDFETFQKASNVSWRTTYELFLQGKLLFERAISDSNVSASYPCEWIDSKYELVSTNATDDQDGSRLDIFPDGEYKGKRRCYGAVTSLQDLAYIEDPSMHSIDQFISRVRSGFIATIPQVAPEEMGLSIATYDMSPQIKLTTMTIEMPYLKDTAYRSTSDYCDGDQLKASTVAEFGTNSPGMLEAARRELCDQNFYPYNEPRSTCGHNNCVFLDKSGTIAFKKQLQLMPYLTNCSVADLEYDPDFLNFFPTGCIRHQNAVFLYGLASFLSGDVFDKGSDVNITSITYPRRHVVLSFAKLEWQMDDLSPKFQAVCGVDATSDPSHCAGLLYPLENVTVPAVNVTASNEKYLRMLVLGNNSLPTDHTSRDFRNPVQLMSLNTRPFYYASANRYYEWEYLDKGRFTETNWPTNGSSGLSALSCSPLLDSYISYVEDNHLYMDRPLQPLYTSALFYLFQNAAVKTVKVSKNITTGAEVLELSVVGTTALKGDREKHVIKFSIPKLSLISTFIGLSLLVLLAVLAVMSSKERLRMSDESRIAAQYAHLLQHDEYPSDVYDRAIMLPSGERIAMDEYVVDSATVHFKADLDRKVFL